MSKKDEQIFIGIDNEVIELTGKAKEEFIQQREDMKKEREVLEAQQKAKQDARENAIKKLAEIAGLTDEEIAAIL